MTHLQEEISDKLKLLNVETMVSVKMDLTPELSATTDSVPETTTPGIMSQSYYRN